MNRFVWDMRYADATTFPNIIMWAATTRGPMIIPGTYQAKLTTDGKSQTQSFVVKNDPRLKTTPEEFRAQLALSLQIRDKLSQTNQAVIDIRDAKRQINEYATKFKDDPAMKKVVDAARDLDKRLTDVEQE